MNNLELLEKYFYTGTAESEKQYLMDVFVTFNEYSEIIKPRSNTIKILVGNKGSGKSALLAYILEKATQNSIPAIRITPAEFGLNFDENTAPGKMINIIRASILKQMAIEVGKNLTGLLNEEENRLFLDAVSSGQNQLSIVTRALKMLAPLGKVITNMDLQSMIPETNITSESRESDISNFLGEDKIFYVSLDDIDQICNSARADYYDIIWCEILAVLKIAQELPNIHPIVSVRKEIWRKLSVDNGNRDKYDQIRNMVNWLNPTREQLKLILVQRLEVCSKKNHIKGNGSYEPFFEGYSCQTPLSQERRLWSDYLVSSSRENPRDIIQLVEALIKSALHNNRNRITDMDVQDTAVEYSTERVDDLVTQNKDLCTNLQTIICSFAKIDYESSVNQLKKHLSSLSGQCSIRLNGKSLQTSNGDDVFALWDFLYNVGFITPRMADSTQSNKYSFIPYDKNLVRASRWNDMQKYTWDVHPCYRSYLADIKEREKKRILTKFDKENYKGNSTRAERNERRKRRNH